MFNSQPEAQEWFEENPSLGTPLDTNGDGSACDFGDWGGLDNHCIVPALGHQDCAALGAEPATNTAPATGSIRCALFNSQPEAQEWFKENPSLGTPLDTNGDGSACDFGDWGGLDMHCGVVAALGHQQCAEPVGSTLSGPLLTENLAPTQLSEDPSLCRLADHRGLTRYVYTEPAIPGADYTYRSLEGSANTQDGRLVGELDPWTMVSLFPQYSMGFPYVPDMLPSQGTFEVMFLAVDFPDAVGSDDLLNRARSLAEEVAEYFRTTSGGRFEPTFRFGDRVFRVPQHSGVFDLQYVPHTGRELTVEILEVADPHVDFTGVDYLYVLTPPTITEIGAHWHGQVKPEGASGQATLVNDNSILTDEGWINGWAGNGAYFYRTDIFDNFFMFYIHETMHEIGLPDLYTLHTWHPNSANNYGDDLIPFAQWAQMSDGARGSGAIIAWHRWLLGWLGEDQVYCLPAGSLTDVEVTVVPLERDAAGFKAVMIPVSDRKVVVVESRRAEGYDEDIGEIPIAVETDGAIRRSFLNWLGTSGLLVYTYDTSVFQNSGPGRVQIPAGRPGFTHVSEEITQAQIDVRNEQCQLETNPDNTACTLYMDPEDENKSLIEAWYDPLVRVGESIIVEGITIELLQWGDYDRVRISK
jgi:M6 family metalloprotease-like protein